MKLCDLDTAKTLQELGYDGEYAKSYTDFGNPTIDITTSLLYPTEIPAPRLDDVAYWLREKYGIHISVIPDLSEIDDAYSYQIWRYYPDDDWSCVTHCVDLSHDEALAEAVKQAIEIIKKL